METRSPRRCLSQQRRGRLPWANSMLVAAADMALAARGGRLSHRLQCVSAARSPAHVFPRRRQRFHGSRCQRRCSPVPHQRLPSPETSGGHLRRRSGHQLRPHQPQSPFGLQRQRLGERRRLPRSPATFELHCVAISTLSVKAPLQKGLGVAPPKTFLAWPMTRRRQRHALVQACTSGRKGLPCWSCQLASSSVRRFESFCERQEEPPPFTTQVSASRKARSMRPPRLRRRRQVRQRVRCRPRR
mmetsp:Transcript_93942/g.265319  ORF Transcript_93942/g.265319 Transcript_93942/m.265319 type:complete len:244 (-) Transcript_93942:275-1006(-)